MFLHIYSGNLYGGIETHLKYLLEADRERSNKEGRPQCHGLALSFRGRLFDELSQNGLSPHDIGKVRFRYPWSCWRARRRLRSIISTSKVQAIVAHASWAYRLAQPVAKKCGVPIAFWNHDILMKSRNQFEAFAAAHPPDWILTNSQFTALSVEKLFQRKADAVIHPLTQLRKVQDRELTRQQIRISLNTPADHKVIVQFSRFERWKGHMQLIEALGQLQTRQNWTVWFAGGVQKPEEVFYLQELKKQALELGVLDKVRFLGARSDIPELLCASDIHCQPNLEPEPFGLVYVEALAAGLPSVASASGGVTEILTPDCGYLIEPGNIHQLALSLSKLIESPALRVQLGHNGMLRAQDLCDSGKTLDSLERILLPTIKFS